MRAIWQGLLSFGLINIPVKMFKATEDQDYHFSLLHNVCHNPLKYQRYCAICNKVVATEEIVRGYEYDKDRFVVLTESELESIAASRTKTIEILSFVQSGEVPIVYYENTYYLQPGLGAEKAYFLLGTALNNQRKDALCRVVLRSSPKLCLVSRMANANSLQLNTIHYGNEVRSLEAFSPMPFMKLNKDEIELAELLIAKLTKPFIPEEYPNTYNHAISELVNKKLTGQEIHVAQKTPEPQVANILEALQASLERVEKNGVPTHAR